jgi:tripartite-type tricarboxylate transporter receptor subunit TctC
MNSILKKKCRRMNTASKYKKFFQRCAAIFAVAVSISATPASAEEHYPDRLVRIVLPYTPGTGADTHTRVLAQHLSERWKVPVIVDNQPGASGSIGAQSVIQSPPDGHTFMVTGESVFSVYMSATPRYEPLKVLRPVARLITVPYAFVARRDFAPQSWAEFVSYARANPDKVTVGTPGYGTPHQVLTELLMNELNLKLFHVPYKGSAGVTQDVLGGRIDVAFLPVPVALPLLASGVRVLAAGGSDRTAALPNAPTYAELGVQSLAHSDSWNGAFVSAATPSPIVEKLSAELVTTLKDPQVAAQIVKLGFTLAPAGADEFARVASETAARWQTALRGVQDKQK